MTDKDHLKCDKERNMPDLPPGADPDSMGDGYWMPIGNGSRKRFVPFNREEPCGNKLDFSVRGDYSQMRWLQSCGLTPDQYAEHRKMFPDVPIDKKTGAVGMRSLSESRRYLKKRGYVDQRAFI